MNTALHETHVALGARMVDFAGWSMPVQYPNGIIHEHHMVREGVGIFDVSHMGRISVKGEEAARFLDSLSTNRLTDQKVGTARYTVLCNEEGGSIDDLLVYRVEEEEFFLIANASNRSSDYDHLLREAERFDVTVRPHFEGEGILALQGPQAPKLLDIPRRNTFIEREGVIVAATGYTGEIGCEIIGPNEKIVELWEELLRKGAHPCGLGARDTLRLEMGYALYGHELSTEIAPTESVSSWTVKWDHEFVGKEALLSLEANPNKRSQCGLILIENGIAREGHKVFQKEEEIGTITSGTHSPSLKKSIAIALTNKKLSPGEFIEIEVRSRRLQAQVTPLPFLTK